MALPLDGFDRRVGPDGGRVQEASDSPFEHVATERLNNEQEDRYFEHLSQSFELLHQRLTSKAIDHDIFESTADFLSHAFFALHHNFTAFDSDFADKISSTLEDLARHARGIQQNCPGVAPSPQQVDDFLRMVDSAQQDLLCSGLMVDKRNIILTLVAGRMFDELKKCAILGSELCFDIFTAGWKDDLSLYLLIMNRFPQEYSLSLLGTSNNFRVYVLLSLCMMKVERAITEKERMHRSLSIGLDGGYRGGKNQGDPDGNDPDRTQDLKDGQGQVRGPQGLGGASFSRRSAGNNANPSIDGSYSWKALVRKSANALCLSTACQIGHSNQNRPIKMSFKTIRARDYSRLLLD